MIEELLERYGINVKRSGESYRGCCPLHNGDNPTAFCINKQGLWYCFSHCGGGNLTELTARLENISKDEAEKRIKEFGIEKTAFSKSLEGKNKPSRIKEVKLKLEPYPEYLIERGVRFDTAKCFGIGINNNVFVNRIIIPIHDENDLLVGYAGRSFDNEEPRYLFKRGFRKNLVIYNFHSVKYANRIILVEGFFDVFRLHQAGFNGMALMGSSISKTEEKLILSLQAIVLMFDGDKAGRKCTEQAIKLFKNKIPLKVIWLKEQLQPDKLDEVELKKLISSAEKIC